MRCLVATWFALGACSSAGPQRVGAEPSWRNGGAHAAPSAGPVTFAPASEPAARYNDAVRSAPSTLLSDAVTAAVHAEAIRANVQVPVADARLFRACAELAAVVPEEGVASYALVEFARQRNGIIEPLPHLLVAWGDVDSPQRVVDKLEPQLAELLGDGATTRFGVGIAKRRADGTGVVVFALQGSGVETLPIPRAVGAGATIAIDAVVDPRYREPELLVTREDGATQRLELKPGRPGGFTSQVACGAHKGRQQIEISASDASGPTVLANFPVWCASQPPASVMVDPAHDDVAPASPAEAEHRLLADVNRDRLAAGLPALRWDDRLAEVARGHSEEMHRTHVVAHVSPTTGSAADRVRVAKIRTGLVLENVARAYGVTEAHDGLMNSPGHRANLMSGVATQIGIGVVFGDGVSGRREMFITQVFTRTPPALDPTKAAAAVRQKLAVVRPTLRLNDKLAELAQRLAEALATGHSREEAYATIKRQVDGLGRVYQRVGSVITATADLDTLEGQGLLGDSPAEDAGVGLAQGPHPEIGDNAIWVVVLLASRRTP
jgi:uncharacterized protein YkwD